MTRRPCTWAATLQLIATVQCSHPAVQLASPIAIPAPRHAPRPPTLRLGLEWQCEEVALGLLHARNQVEADAMIDQLEASVLGTGIKDGLGHLHWHEGGMHLASGEVAVGCGRWGPAMRGAGSEGGTAGEDAKLAHR